MLGQIKWITEQHPGITHPTFYNFSWKVSELESVRIGKRQNWNLSELECVRIIWSLNIPYKWDKYCLSSNLNICHVPTEVSYAMICITMVTQAKFAPYLKNLKILTLSDSDTFQFCHCPWHFPILTLPMTLSNSDTAHDTFQFWLFPIPGRLFHNSSLKIRLSTFPNFINFVNWRILKLKNCERVGTSFEFT